MEKEKIITYEFIRYIHQTMINEKLKYIEKSDKKRFDKNGLKVIHSEKLLENIQYQNEQLILCQHMSMNI